MPIEVTKYTCQFKCFKKAVSDIRKMVAHESQCWNNPENKTCKTCKNEVAYTDKDDYHYTPVRACKISQLADFFDTFTQRLRPTEVTMQVRPVYHCPYHNQEPDDNIELFVEEITNEFGTNESGTLHFPYYIPSVKQKALTL